jgi:hypothetical protein
VLGVGGILAVQPGGGEGVAADDDASNQSEAQFFHPAGSGQKDGFFLGGQVDELFGL